MPKLCVFSSFADLDHSLTRFGSDILRRPDPPGPDIGLNMLQLERMFFVFKLFIIILLISCQILYDRTLDPFFNLRPVHLLPPLIAQDIIAQSTRNQDEYMKSFDDISQYMLRMHVPEVISQYMLLLRMHVPEVISQYMLRRHVPEVISQYMLRRHVSEVISFL